MIVNRCVEQGIYVVLILSLEKDHRPLRSMELSSILAVSDSYLKKILRKLVLAGIITSNTGREGGFQLACSLEEISVYDIYSALEGKECELKSSGIGSRIFIDDKKFLQGEEMVSVAFERAYSAFSDELRQVHLSDLVTKEFYLKGSVRFEDRVTEIKQKEGSV